VTETSTLEAFIQAYEVLRRFIRRRELVEGNSGLSRVQAMIVRHLHSRGSRTVGELAKYFAVRPSTMSQMIDRLELAGLVDRSADDHDARVRRVTLTPRGLAMVRELRDVRLRVLKDPFGQLTPHEQATLAELLGKLARGLPGAPRED